MPTKKKASTPSETAKNDSSKRFVVEEKTDTEAKDSTINPSEEIKSSESLNSDIKIEDSSIQKEEGGKDENETKVTSTESPPKEELKTEEAKDTIPNANVTSFSLLDADKKEGKNMEEDTKVKTESTPETANAPISDSPVKPSQDEVNKWIENYDDKESVEKKKGSGFFKTFLIILIILAVLATIVGGVFYYQKNISGTKKTNESSNTTQEAPLPEPTSTPTTAPEEVDYSKYTLRILNGSGVPGEAGKVEEMLDNLTFKSITTGNADNYDYTTSEIALKEGVPDQVFTDIKNTLDSTYTFGSNKETLDSSSSYDVVITVGQKK